MASTASSRGSAAALALLFSAPAFAAELVPTLGHAVLPDGFAAFDDRGTGQDLRALAQGAPTLLLPIFTRCTGTCPMTAHYLKQGLAQAQSPFRVIVLSFDPADRTSDLREFRDRFALPERWTVVRAADAGATRSFLDRLGFHFMRSGEGYDHPNETFVFSPKGTWAATLAGASFAAPELETAWKRALSADDPGALQRAASWLRRPEAWILIASAGIALALAVIFRPASRARSSRDRTRA